MTSTWRLAMQHKLLSRAAVRDRVLYSYTHISRLEAQGQFPKRVRLSNHPRGRCGWLEQDIEKWLAERIKDRDAS
jgi:predicted DNA-binding transcriptional regulator AlpA